VQTLNLQDIIHFEPPVPITELLHWYQRCTVHVNLTPTGFGDKVALEAIACGKMCLVANEGFRETLGEYAAELLFRFGDAEDLSDRLAYVLSMPETQKSAIGSYLAEQVVKMHSLERLAQNLMGLFALAKTQ